MIARVCLTVCMLTLVALPAFARPPHVSRAEQAEKVEREADALTRANPSANPGATEFYRGTPYAADFVLRLCAQPGSRLSPATCRAAGDARRFDPR